VDLKVLSDQDVLHGIAIGVQLDVTLHADAALVHVIDFWHVDRERHEQRLFGDKHLRWQAR
jgi:hypothetical protein